jgi:hypothetical protein
MKKKRILYKIIFVLFLFFILGGTFSLISSESAHAAVLVNPYPGSNPPSCDSSHIEDLTDTSFYFRTHINCTLQVSKITSTAFAQYESYKDVSYTNIGPTTRSSCTNCSGLLNPNSGGLIGISIGNNPPGSYRVYEIISWTYTDRGGTHTESKNVVE